MVVFLYTFLHIFLFFSKKVLIYIYDAYPKRYVAQKNTNFNNQNPLYSNDFQIGIYAKFQHFDLFGLTPYIYIYSILGV